MFCLWYPVLCYKLYNLVIDLVIKVWNIKSTWGSCCSQLVNFAVFYTRIRFHSISWVSFNRFFWNFNTVLMATKLRASSILTILPFAIQDLWFFITLKSVIFFSFLFNNLSILWPILIKFEHSVYGYKLEVMFDFDDFTLCHSRVMIIGPETVIFASHDQNLGQNDREEMPSFGQEKKIC